MENQTKIFKRGRNVFEAILINTVIREYDFVVSKQQFEKLDENGFYHNHTLNKDMLFDIEQVRLINGELQALCFSGDALQKMCSVVIINQK